MTVINLTVNIEETTYGGPVRFTVSNAATGEILQQNIWLPDSRSSSRRTWHVAMGRLIARAAGYLGG